MSIRDTMDQAEARVNAAAIVLGVIQESVDNVVLAEILGAPVEPVAWTEVRVSALARLLADGASFPELVAYYFEDGWRHVWN